MISLQQLKLLKLATLCTLPCIASYPLLLQAALAVPHFEVLNSLLHFEVLNSLILHFQVLNSLLLHPS